MTEEKEPIYLVDGSGYIYRAFYAVQPLSTKTGLPTNALFGFSRMIQKLIKDVRAKYIAVMFDTKAPTFRHLMYTPYKANRKECPPELVAQMPYFREIVKAFGIAALEQEGVEADDIIATLAQNFSALARKIIVVSGDKDLCQLVTEDCMVWDAMRDIKYDREGVISKFGVPPEQMLDYLTLVGDSSDNIPGVQGVGPKTAVSILSQIKTIEQILEAPAILKSFKGIRGVDSLCAKIESSRESIALSQKLVALKSDVSPFTTANIDDLLISAVDEDEIKKLYSKLEFSIPNLSPTAVSKNKNFQLVTPAELDSFVEQLREQKEFAFDTETTSLDILTCKLVGLSFSWKTDEGYYLPIIGPEEDSAQLHSLGSIQTVFGDIFRDPKIKKIGANLKFDLQVLLQHGIAVNGLSFDDMLASYVLTPDRRQHGLKALAKNYLNEAMTTFEEVVGNKNDISAVAVAAVTAYAAHDAEASWSLKTKLEPLLGDLTECSLKRVFEEVEMPLIQVLATMERRGIKIDLPLLQSLSQQIAVDLERLEKQVFELAGNEFNLNSPKQLSNILFDVLKIPTAGVKKNQGAFSTDASVLEKLAGEHEIAKILLEYRELFKLKSTYVDSLQQLVRPSTGRIHTSYNQAVAATGRLSSSDPNLQNIPIRNPRGREIRRAFIADEGMQFISADYSQIELRILAHLSEDVALRKAFLNDQDIHAATARDIFGEFAFNSYTEEQRKDARRVAKTINFGVIYGISAFRLAGELGISRKQAQIYIDNYFGRYPKVRSYLDSLSERAQKEGFVETMFGRRRYLSEIDASGRDAGYAARSVMNAPIQGTAAEIIKLAMIKLHEQFQSLKLKTYPLLLQVHDELLFEIPNSEVNEMLPMIVKVMEEAVSLSVPLKVDIKIAPNWG
jgi:DNA polymerase-1